MNEIEIESVTKNLVDTLEKKDVERAVSTFTDDAEWFTPNGTFKGKNEIRRYISWMTNNLKDLKFVIDGVGILIQGNKGIHQSIYEGIYRGIKVKAANICTYEFAEDKIKRHWTVNDRLSLASQVAKGPIARKAVNTIIAKAEAGLH